MSSFVVPQEILHASGPKMLAILFRRGVQMLETSFTRLLGCALPIQSAPMGQVSTPALVEAVSTAGGHGMLGVANAPQPVVASLLDEVERRGVRHYGLNFLVPFADPDVVAFAASRVRLVDFYLGEPDRTLIEAAHSGGAIAGWQVTSRAEAMSAVDLGCDLLIAHGIEAGGRIPRGIGLFPLLEQILSTVDVPVIAAGGIATGRGIAAALAAGAAAVRLGTTFVASAETGAHPRYVERLLAASAEDTVYTTAFKEMLPPHLSGARVLADSVAAAERLTSAVVGRMPIGPQMLDIPRWGVPPPTIGMEGEIDAMPMYAGESVAMIDEVRPAAEIVRDLADQAQQFLRVAGTAFA